MRSGIIDIGSNTMRLVIYEKGKNGKLKEIQNVKVVARLRNYLDIEGYLNQEGVEKLINTLLLFENITSYHNISDIKCVATATLRQATNREEISNRIEEETSFSIRILSEYEEAYYGYLAVVNSTPFQDGITIDIGGGSTEITYFKNRELVSFHSFPFGVLSLRQQFVKDELPTEEEVASIDTYIKEQFSSLPWLRNKKLPIIAIGGSARNVAQMDQAMKKYPLAGLHLYELKMDDIQSLRIYLNSLEFTQVQKIEGLSKDRAELMIPAMVVFEKLLEAVDSQSFVLSRKGLREGIFLEEVSSPLTMKYYPSVVDESLKELAFDYEIDIENALQVRKILTDLIKNLSKEDILEISEADFKEINRASFVFYLGQYIDSEASSQHTFYLLANRTIDGLLHKERLRIALLASYKNKTVFKQYTDAFQNWFTSEELKRLRLFGALLKFAYSLNATKRNVVKQIKVQKESDTLYLLITCKDNWEAEQYQAEKQVKHLEKYLKSTIQLVFTRLNS